MQSILCTEFRKNYCQMISRLSYILTATTLLLMNAIEKSALSRLDEFVTSRDKFQLVNEFSFIIYRLYICTHSLKLNPFFAKKVNPFWKMNPLGFCILFTYYLHKETIILIRKISVLWLFYCQNGGILPFFVVFSKNLGLSG